MNRILLLFLFLLFLIPIQTNAQDIHFSHVHASPTLINPAMTGLFDGDIRLISNFKSQWNTVTKGYKTIAGSMDMKLAEAKGNNSFGGGLVLYSDKAGDLDFTTNAINVSFSILRALNNDGNHYLSFGIQNSFVNNNLNIAKIISRDQEPLIASGAYNKLSYWDIGAGVGWFYSFDRYSSIYLGASVFHITEPSVALVDNGDSYLFRKYTIHGGADLDLGKSFSIKPNFIFTDQGPHKEIVVGSFLKYSSKSKMVRRNKSPASIYFGAWIRWYVEKDIIGADAIVTAFRLDYNNTFLTFSFDMNISSYTRVSYGRGGPELSLMKTIDLGKQKRRTSKVKCPTFFY